jgi:hypothetical protein
VNIGANGGAKRAGRYESAFRAQHQIGFGKRRVAEKIKAIALRDGFDQESEVNMRCVVERLIVALKSQSSGPQAASAVTNVT